MRPTLLILLLCAFCQDLRAKEILVSAGSIQSLEQSIAKAAPGDSVLIPAGTYKPAKTIEINKPIFLIGLNHPIIDGSEKIEIMVIKSSFVIIKGLHLRNSGRSGYNDIAALRIMQSGHILIVDNQFENCFFGVYGQHAYQSTIANNTFQASGIDEQSSANGIHCWKSENLQILNNRISGHRDGIYFESPAPGSKGMSAHSINGMDFISCSRTTTGISEIPFPITGPELP
jgi:nitrous oxidase accessory protein